MKHMYICGAFMAIIFNNTCTQQPVLRQIILSGQKCLVLCNILRLCRLLLNYVYAKYFKHIKKAEKIKKGLQNKFVYPVWKSQSSNCRLLKDGQSHVAPNAQHQNPFEDPMLKQQVRAVNKQMFVYCCFMSQQHLRSYQDGYRPSPSC